MEGTWAAIKYVTLSAMLAIVDYSKMAFEWIMDQWPKVKDMFMILWQTIVDGAKVAWEGMAETFRQFYGWFLRQLGLMIANFVLFYDSLKRVATGRKVDWHWMGLEESFKASLEGIQGGFDKVTAAMGKKMDEVRNRGGGKGMLEGMKESMEKAKADMDAAFSGMGDKYDANLKQNRDKVAGWVKELEKIMEDPFKAPAWKRPDKIKDPSAPDSEKKDANTNVGGFEALEELNKRIQGAAMKNPVVEITEKQRKDLAQYHKEQMEARRKYHEDRKKAHQQDIELRHQLNKEANILRQRNGAHTEKVFKAIEQLTLEIGEGRYA